MLSVAAVVALLGPAALALSGCEPASADGLDAVTAAVTTDKRATGLLKDKGYPVQWMTCTGRVEDPGANDKGSPHPVSAIGVECEGRTGGGQKIIVYGRVTGMHGETCVRGRLTAKVDGKTAFSVAVLGECSGSGVTTGGSGGKPDDSNDGKHDGKNGDKSGDKHDGKGHEPGPDCTDKHPHDQHRGK
ncbi:hypothetical protein ACFQ2B_21790 [Streptomyces stramineus]